MKLQYYKDNNWEDHFIKVAESTITMTWNKFYKNEEPLVNESDNSDDLLDHVFKKQKTETNDELKIYLGRNVELRTTNALDWWKVYLFN